jgi:hypothetical protein
VNLFKGQINVRQQDAHDGRDQQENGERQCDNCGDRYQAALADAA